MKKIIYSLLLILIANMANSQIIINGKTYTGKSVFINNGNVIIDGKEVTPKDSKIITISIVGNVTNLSVDVCKEVTITGDVGKVETQSGDVKIGGQVSGSVNTVTCMGIKGYVLAEKGETVAYNVNKFIPLNGRDEVEIAKERESELIKIKELQDA